MKKTNSYYIKYIKYFLILSITVFSIYLINASQYILYDSSNNFLFNKALLGIIIFTLLYHLSKYAYKINIYTIVFISFLLYLFWGIYASVTPVSDFTVFYNLSVQYATSFDAKILYTSKSPTTTAYYAFFVFLLGKSYLAFYIASSLIWSVQIIILYKALSNFNFSENQAKFIALMYGLYPGIIFYATVVSSESVFMFFLITSFYFVSKISNDTFTKKDTIQLGLLLSLFFLTRSNAVVFIIPYILYFFLSKSASRSGTFLVVIAMILPLLFQLFLNIKYGDRLSLSASQWGTYNLMVGTNPKSKGGYNESDKELAGIKKEDAVPLKQAQKNALKIAYHRIFKQPMDFIIFATTTKIKRLWETDRSSLDWSIAKSPTKKNIIQEIEVGSKILEASFLMIILTSLGYLLERLYRCKENLNSSISVNLLLLTIVPLLLLAFLHIFIEVQPRYHLPFLPFLIVFSGLFILDLQD